MEGRRYGGLGKAGLWKRKRNIGIQGKWKGNIERREKGERYRTTRKRGSNYGRRYRGLGKAALRKRKRNMRKQEERENEMEKGGKHRKGKKILNKEKRGTIYRRRKRGLGKAGLRKRKEIMRKQEERKGKRKEDTGRRKREENYGKTIWKIREDMAEEEQSKHKETRGRERK